ncbi:helix-turn-helix domain-containing protein [Paenibacillus chartarius]|uniref:Helix-turn-helix domain-containing protein n=1 Tax=Paenibacillus chartarius TaxID=747481 RepID=A0ABV6DSM2_9BACL
MSKLAAGIGYNEGHLGLAGLRFLVPASESVEGDAAVLSKKGSFYRNTLIIILLIASVPGLVTGLSIYGIVTGRIESELQRLHHNKLIEQEHNIESQFANLEMTFSHWTYDPGLGAKLKELDFVRNYDQVQELYRTLLIIEGSNALIGKVELYLSTPRPVVLTKEGYSFVNDTAEVQKYESMLQQRKALFWTDESAAEAGKAAGADEGVLTLVSKVPGVPAEPFGLLIAQLDGNKLKEQLKSLNPYEEGTALMIAGDSGRRFSSGERQPQLEQALQALYTKRSADVSDTRDESMLYEVEGKTYSVSASEFSRLGAKWVFMSAVPLSNITAPVLLVSKIILLISIGGLLIAMALTWFASSRLFAPFERVLQRLFGNPELKLNASGFEWIESKWQAMTRESTTLREQLDRHTPALREGFLMQLVQGYLFALSETEIKDRLKQLGIDVEGKQFAAMVVQLRGMTDPEARFSQSDAELLAFAVGNIAQELGHSKGIPCETLNYHDMSLSLFLTFPGDYSAEQCRERMKELGEELIQVIGGMLKLQAVVVLGHMTAQLGHISYVFEEARQSISYWDVGGKSELIDVEQLNKSLAQREFHYNFTLEKEIIHALRLGSEEEAVKLIRQFMLDLSQAGFKKLIIQQGMLQLLGSIQHAMLQSGMNPIVLFEGASVYEEFQQLNEPDEMLSWFQSRIVGTYVQELISKQDFQLKQVVEKVMAYIREHYATDLSLESCADMFGTSPYTLSRAFKQATGINFIDYLTNMRIGTAKELLQSTQLKMSEIAEKVGYQHTYFNRIFKKVEGMTPSQYRDMVQSDRQK